MERENKSGIVIDIEGWRKIEIENTFTYPNEVRDVEAYLEREKMLRFVNTHPNRMYKYYIDGQEHIMDCKTSPYLAEKQMRGRGAEQRDIDVATSIARQFPYFYGKISTLSKKAYGGNFRVAGSVLEAKAEELLDLFGRLYTLEEVYRIVIEEWGYNINQNVIKAFYHRNLKAIEKLRDQYQTDFSDVALTKKRSRLDKLSIMFYTYYNKWSKDARLEYSKELRAILEHIRKEVEGDSLNLNVQGQINIDMTIEANKTLFDAYKQIPVNNLILALVAAKKNLDPTKLMAQLTNSYYSSLTGYGTEYNSETQLVHPVDLTYNWNEINRKHKNKEKELIEDAKIVTSAGSMEKDAKLLTVKNKLMAILETDREENTRRRNK
jgi:hypothetical protein